jgi:hypothetical protein
VSIAEAKTTTATGLQVFLIIPLREMRSGMFRPTV